MQTKANPHRAAGPTANDEDILFALAMKDVKLLPEGNRVVRMKDPDFARNRAEAPSEGDREALNELIRLVLKGEGFSISDTPEYMEGTGYNIHPIYAARLHRGDFSIQGHLDLHGMTAATAKLEFEEFLDKSIKYGKRAILVIHGRGLSSPGEPILKAKVQEWLSKGHWRKWVIAFSSASAYDGGAGATYILLRSHPVSKRLRKK